LSFKAGEFVIYRTESEFETYIRRLIKNRVTKADPAVYTLKSKKAVDIIVCRDAPKPKLFFIEVKFHMPNHGRLGFGHGKGGGFQPEIMNRQTAYFERNLRWVLASEIHRGKVLFLSSRTLRKYVSGGKVEQKFNNIQVRVFREETGLTQDQFVCKLRRWLGVGSAE
jgi:hypothetical protein